MESPVTALGDAELDALQRAAEAATPGPWHANSKQENTRLGLHRDIGGDMNATRMLVASTWGAGEVDANAAHIAAASPDTVLALVAEVRRLRRWKAEASTVAMDLQPLAHLLELDLGTYVGGPEAADAVAALIARVQRAEGAVERVKALLPAFAPPIYDRSGRYEGRAAGGEHRTVGMRAWCFSCGEWCYPTDGMACPCCEAPVDPRDLRDALSAAETPVAPGADQDASEGSEALTDGTTGRVGASEGEPSPAVYRRWGVRDAEGDQ